MAEESDDLTPEEKAVLAEYIGENFPTREEKPSMIGFFNKIIGTTNTSKVSNLDDQELFVIRSLQTAALFSKEMNLKSIHDYLMEEAEIILGTANSKKGFLINMAVTTKKEQLQSMKLGQEGKTSWFKKKQE